jgi:metallo-beta-lactamase family protein
MKLRFLGATKQVTGSRYLVSCGGIRVLVDCGMFQEREHLKRNWADSPVSPDSVDFLLLTHAHLDHCGLIPRFVAQGFDKPIVMTAATRDLAEIVLRDAAAIQEEDAAFKKGRHEREGRTGPHPVKPLFTKDDVERSLPLFRIISYGQTLELNDQVRVRYHDAGHILGAAQVEVEVEDNGGRRTIVFSGDLGPRGKPIVHDPAALERADFVVMESTYGDREHIDGGNIEDQLAEIINDTVKRGGNILIPTFAIERAQDLMFYLGRLVHQGRIPNLLVFLDSPMAVDVTEVFRSYEELMNEPIRKRLAQGRPMFEFPGLHLVRSVAESKGINKIRGSCIVLAGSGMCTAGRIKHHLVKNVSRPESTVVFTGYQAYGTLGRELVDGKNMVRIQGQQHVVRAAVKQIYGLSAHADQSELLEWVGRFDSPRKVFLTHGEAEATSALAEAIRSRYGLSVEVPEYLGEYELV